jgi:hypothetical protein
VKGNGEAGGAPQASGRARCSRSEHGWTACYARGNGEAGGMIDWVISGVLLIIIVSTLVMLRRADRRRRR